MAYGNVTGYEPTQIPGAYQFVDKTGNKWMLSGGPAEDLKARLDASASLMPELAANDQGKPKAKLDAGGGLAQRLAAQNQAAGRAAEAQNLAPLPQEANLDARAAAQAPAQPGAAAAVQQAPAQGGVRSLGGGLYEKDGLVGRFHGPSAGSPGGLELRGETRQGVQPLDPAFLAEQDQFHAVQANALQEKQAAEKEQFANELAHKQEMEKMAVNAAAEEENRKREIDSKVADLQSRYDKAEKEVANAKIDPNGGVSFLDSVWVGLGTAAQILTKQPNMATELVQRKIDRHIAAQEHAINIKRETKNDLARMLEANEGNRDTARLALTAAYMKKAQSTFEARAAATGNKDLKATHLMQAAQFGDAYSKYRQALTAKQYGEVTQTYTNRPAQAASAGGFVPEPDQLATRGKMLDVKKKEMELAAGPDGGKPAAGNADKAKRLSAINASLLALEEFKETSAKAGKVYTTKYGDQPSKELGAAAGAAGPMIARATEGDAATADSMKRVVGGLTAMSPETREAYRAALEQQLLRQKAAIESE